MSTRPATALERVAFLPRTQASYRVYPKIHIIEAGETRTLCKHWDVKADAEQMLGDWQPTKHNQCFVCQRMAERIKP